MASKVKANFQININSMFLYMILSRLFRAFFNTRISLLNNINIEKARFAFTNETEQSFKYISQLFTFHSVAVYPLYIFYTATLSLITNI